MTDRTILHDLLQHATETPERLAFDVAGERITWSALKAGSLKCASALAAFGIKGGTHCALLLPTSGDLFCIFLGLQFRRAIPCVLNPAMPARSLVRRMIQMDMRFVVGSTEFLSRIREESHGLGLQFIELEKLDWKSKVPITDFELPASTDISHFQLTSGTSGDPRAAIILHRGAYSCTKVWTDLLDLDPERDVFVAWVPLYHDLGMIRYFMQPIQSGCSCYFLEASIRNFRPWLETISRVRGTVSGGPDFAYRIAARIVKADGLDLSSWRIATNGAEPVRISTLELFEKTFGLQQIIMPGYGMAEMTLGISMMRPGELRRVDSSGAVACGKIFPDIEVKIVDESGNELPPNSQGEIVASGVPIFAGYYGDSESTAAVLRDGWVYTGDVGKLDEDGFVYILGRKRAMIKRAGALLAPREIEEVVDRIPGVRLCAAVGFVREEFGGTEDVAIVAEVRPEDAVSESSRSVLRVAIGLAVKEAIGFNPAKILLVEPRTIPRTGNGKIRYIELRNAIASDEFHKKVLC